MKQSLISLFALAATPVLSSDCGTITSWVTVTADAVTSESSSKVLSTFVYSTTNSILSSVTSTDSSSTSQKTTLAVATSTTSAVVYETIAESSTKAAITTSQAAAIETTATAEVAVTSTNDDETSTTTSEVAASSTISSSATSSSGSSSQVLGGSVTGEATYYGGNIAGGTCSFTTYTLPSGLFGTAFSGSSWDSASHCGECVEVTGPSGNSITAMVVDECPECEVSHLDLFEDAFAELGAISAGIISISYEFVSCPITSSIQLHSKSGTSAYFFSMQVVNANEPVSTLEVSTDGGSTWQATTRRDYNFFENSSGFGVDTVSVRITSSSGATVTVDNVSCDSDAQITASSNF